MTDREHQDLVAQEVERVFGERGWKSVAQAEIATGLPSGTLKRLKQGLGKAETVARFGALSGESEERWKRIAMRLPPDEKAEEVVGNSENKELARVPNQRLVELMERIQGLDPAQQAVTVDTIDAFVTSFQRVTSKAVGTIGRGEDIDDLVVEDITDDESKFEE